MLIPLFGRGLLPSLSFQLKGCWSPASDSIFLEHSASWIAAVRGFGLEFSSSHRHVPFHPVQVVKSPLRVLFVLAYPVVHPQSNVCWVSVVLMAVGVRNFIFGELVEVGDAIPVLICLNFTTVPTKAWERFLC